MDSLCERVGGMNLRSVLPKMYSPEFRRRGVALCRAGGRPEGDNGGGIQAPLTRS